ncbi:Pentatricopeptide repeat-containing protein [Quillaja saponaria]|uniref:Pentatricopeptide repeat-containing protein n=1 Tax=Quillaja saponaria TaxID=32244 RepID=A0AAD7LI87_QUISA|nr:Pentatricopeptide repeat-containing protein [Quillaja saponaria]
MQKVSSPASPATKSFSAKSPVKSILHVKSVSYANCLFNRIHERNRFFYNAFIKVYTSSENPRMAISMFNNMRLLENLVGDEFTYPLVLKACATEFFVEKGKEFHGLIIRIVFEADQFLYSSLLSFYSICGEIENARKVFDEFVRKDIVFWYAMIMCYPRNGMVLEALGVLKTR